MAGESEYAKLWRDAVPSPRGALQMTRWRARRLLLSALGRSAPAPSGRFLRCLFCHYVFDDQRADFERLLLTLRRYGTFVDTDRCIALLEGREPIDGPYFHLSFDDGFRNVYTNALPILERHRIPAIAFLPSAIIAAGLGQVRRYCLEVARYRGLIEMMTWEDARDFVARGYEVGSHTRTHARLASISSDRARLEDEVVGSKREIEDRLGRPCDYISWPFGQAADIDAASLELIRSVGYRACFAAHRGSIRPGRTDRFGIPRHHFEAQWPVSHVTYFAGGRMELAG